MTSSQIASDPQIQDVVDGVHGDPHRILGVHVDSDTACIRVLRPNADHVSLLLHDGSTMDMEQIHSGGVFEVNLALKRLSEDRAYRVEARYPSGERFLTEDPYRFWPTIGDLDLYLFGQGRHEHLWRILGARVQEHQGVRGVAFSVWAPNARSVRVVGEFNYWQGAAHPMRRLGASGVWELFIPGLGEGTHYKFEILEASGRVAHRADPFAFATEIPPATASIVYESQYHWGDNLWFENERNQSLDKPMSVYEVHLGSWKRKGANGEEHLSYRELAEELGAYLDEMGFTHVELMPVAEHPFGGSWGYQVSSYFAPTSRFGSVDDFKYLIDSLHRRGIGVIVDWVPAHFPKDDWALARFDGSALFEHDDPRMGEHPDWGTLVFNFGRHEIRNFLISNALYWLQELHIDGLRVDAVASMLYLDYSRKDDEWVPNEFGGRENLDAVSFLKELNETVYRLCPGAMTIAEESTAWPGVSRPTYLGGLGFGLKWNMGWMHDTLHYFSRESVHRRFHHNDLTFGLVYAWHENFVLPLSHDEVVHGKGSLYGKMPGDKWQKHANLRTLFAWMWAHPGKKLIFMGGELAQSREWSHERSLDWDLLEFDEHKGTQLLVRQLNELYRDHPALWQNDFSDTGFRWIDASDVDQNVISFMRLGDEGTPPVVCIANLSPIPRYQYRIGLPQAGPWKELLNTDAAELGGSGVGNLGGIVATEESWHGLDALGLLTLPPLSVLWLTPER